MNLNKNTMILKLHPLAELFPPQSPTARQALKDDIATNGQRVPIIINRKGEVLDGRHRWEICLELEIEPLLTEVDCSEDELLSTIVSLNLHRRHLSQSQQALVAAKFIELKNTAANETPTSAILRPQATGKISKQAANQFHVSSRTVENALKVVRSQNPKLIAAVETEAIKVSVASELANLPVEKQNEALNGGEDGVQNAVKELRSRKSATKLKNIIGENVEPENNAVSDSIYQQIRSLASHLAANLREVQKNTAPYSGPDADILNCELKSLIELLKQTIGIAPNPAPKHKSSQSRHQHEPAKDDVLPGQLPLINTDASEGPSIHPIFKCSPDVEMAAKYLSKIQQQNWIEHPRNKIAWFIERLAQVGEFFRVNPACVPEEKRERFVISKIQNVMRLARSRGRGATELAAALANFKLKNMNLQNPRNRNAIPSEVTSGQ